MPPSSDSQHNFSVLLSFLCTGVSVAGLLEGKSFGDEYADISGINQFCDARKLRGIGLHQHEGIFVALIHIFFELRDDGDQFTRPTPNAARTSLPRA
ncbi:exported hypothetical protein [Verrucomicrobia bacterium]|nr:exported hypothetical protein [Verrucomicrobiota bacterium]